MANSNDSALYLRIPTDLKVKLHEIATQRGRRRFSMMVREVLEKFVTEESEKVSA